MSTLLFRVIISQAGIENPADHRGQVCWSGVLALGNFRVPRFGIFDRVGDKTHRLSPRPSDPPDRVTAVRDDPISNSDSALHPHHNFIHLKLRGCVANIPCKPQIRYTTHMIDIHAHLRYMRMSPGCPSMTANRTLILTLRNNIFRPVSGQWQYKDVIMSHCDPDIY